MKQISTPNKPQGKYVEEKSDSTFMDHLFSDLPLNHKIGKSKFVAFKEIRFKAGKIEADYMVNGGRVTSEGTLILRIGSDEELGKLAAELANQLAKIFREFERS